MHRPLIALLFVCLLTAAAAPAMAGEDHPLELEGELIQGALVFGRTQPGAEVRFAGRDVRVSPSGTFLLGFGRNADRTESLVIEYPDGERLERTLEVARRDYDIQHIEGVPQETVTPPESALEEIRADIRLVSQARQRNDARTDFLADFEWPLEGPITGVYGSQRVYNGEPKRPHYGVDIAAPKGAVVRAPAPGIITVAEADMYYSGGTVLLDHGHGLSSSFLHLSELEVEVGDRLEQGDPIGAVGAGGRATGTHLDWRINLFDRRLDPTGLVGPMPESASSGAH